MMSRISPQLLNRAALGLAVAAPAVTMVTIFGLEWAGFYRNPVDAYGKKNTMLVVLLVLPSLAAMWLAMTGLIKLRREKDEGEEVAAGEKLSAKLAIVLGLLWLVGLFPYSMIRYTREGRMYQTAVGRERISQVLDLCVARWKKTGEFPQSLDELLADPAVRERVKKEELLTWPYTRKVEPIMMVPQVPGAGGAASASATQARYADIRSDWIYVGNDLALTGEQFAKHGNEIVLMLTDQGAMAGGACVGFASGKTQLVKEKEVAEVVRRSQAVRAALTLPPAHMKRLDEPVKGTATQAATRATQPG